MRWAMFVAACALVSACGSSSDGSGGSGGTSNGGAGGTTSVGQASGDSLFVQMQLSVQLTTPPSAYAAASAFDNVTNQTLDGATVTLTPEGGDPVTLPGGSGAGYQAALPGGWAASYELSVTHPAGSRTGIIVTPPSQYTVTVDPAPKVGAESTVTWTPSGEAGVGAYIIVGQYGTPSASPLPDSGSFTLPATTFVAPGGNQLTLTMQRERAASVPQKVSIQTIVTAFQSLSVQP